MSISIDQFAKNFDAVVRYIDNHKFEIVEDLFGGSTDDYKKEWYDRSVEKFWYHLDLGNQKRVISAALLNSKEV